MENRQDSQRHDNDADTAEPLQKRPPKQKSRRYRVEVLNHRGTGGGDAGHGLEKGVGEGEVKLRKGERQGRENGQHDPAQGRQDKGLARI